MDAADIKAKIEAIMREEPRFAEEAYAFVANAVTFTVGRLPAHRHVSALELLGGVRDYAREEFGVLAYEVLYEWGIRSASDVGRIVYLLIGSGLLSASKDEPGLYNQIGENRNYAIVNLRKSRGYNDTVSFFVKLRIKH